MRRLTEERRGEVRALVLPGDSAVPLDGLNCRIFRGDVTDPASLNSIFETSEAAELYVIHCAAVVSIQSRPNPRMYEVNVNGTRNVVEKVLEKRAKLICVSSVHALPEKPNHEVIAEISRFDPRRVEGQYAKTKAEAAGYVLEKVRREGLNACIVHPSGIIGPYDYGNSHLTQLIVDFACGRLRACVKGGYDFVDVRDAADGIVNACGRGGAGECYILSGRYAAVRELLDMVSEVRGAKKIRTILPMWLAKLTAPLSEMYYAALRQPPLYTKYSLYTLESNSNFSNGKARRELGFRNRALRETVEDAVAWLEKSGRIRA